MGSALVGRTQPYEFAMRHNCSDLTVMLQKCSAGLSVPITSRFHNCLSGNLL